MDTISRETLTSLARHSSWPSVSLYATMHRVVAEKAEDRIRLKNLLSSAATRLVADGIRAPEADALLAKTTALLTDTDFWRDSADGLAIFSDSDATTIYRVDTALPEEVVVGDRFHIRPLVLAYHGDERFFALAFDLNATRLFSGDRTSIRELPITNAPTSLAESSKYDSREESLQYTTHSSPESVNASGQTIGMFHGHGGENVDKTELAQFASKLDRAVTRIIGAENTTPLLLLGVGNELSEYRAVNTYPGIATAQVFGATDELTEVAIHRLVLNALAPRFSAMTDADLTELREKPSSLVSDDPSEIVSAAASGRVKTLFFDEALGPFGHLDRQLLQVSQFAAASPRYLRDSAESEVGPEMMGWDLVDLALAETILHGGEVHAFIGEDAPVKGVAAVLRY